MVCISSSSEVIRVFGSSGLTKASGWATRDGDGTIVFQNKFRVRTDLKNRSHRWHQTIRTQFFEVNNELDPRLD
jgi:hypothetical protein